MYLNTRIQDHSFLLSIGSGYNDWAWLSHYVARKFSKISYPQGNYLPTHLEVVSKDGSVFQPIPKEKINMFLQEHELSADSITVHVKIRKPNYNITEDQKRWQRDAFGLERFMVNVVYLLETNLEPNKKGSKDYYFKVSFDYMMNPEVKHIFVDKKYQSPIMVQLEEKPIGQKSCTFTAQFKVPFGKITPELHYYWKDPKDPSSYREEKVKDVKLKQDFKVSFSVTPKIVSCEQLNSKVNEEMKIADNITKSLQEKELEAKKRNTNSSLCCYTFEQLWNIVETNHGDQLLIESYDASTRQRLKIILEKSLNSIYQIFFYYFIIENQNKQKKEELGITYQHVMHFLRYYTIFADIQGLQNFMEFYNSDYKFKNIKDTVDIEEKIIKFPQFIAILLRAIQFIQTSTFMVKGETFDVSVAKIIDRIIEIDGEEEQFSVFKRNLRQNHKIISFFRNNNDKLKQTFVNQAIRSTQNSADSFVIMKEQFKSMLELSGLTNKNTDSIVADLFEELLLSDDGVFYYQFLQAIQWLAMGLVTSDKDETVFENDEEEALLIIQKIKFFMERIQL